MHIILVGQLFRNIARLETSIIYTYMYNIQSQTTTRKHVFWDS